MVRKMKNLLENEKDVVKLNPKKLIPYFYNKINIKTAAIVILISLLFELIIFAIMGVPNLVSYFFLNLLYTYLISWFVVGGILYLILYFIKGKNNLEKNVYSKILSALAAFRVINIFVLLLFLAIVLVFVPKLIGFIKGAFLTSSLSSSSLFPLLNSWNSFGLILLLIFSLAVIVYYIFAVYYLIKEVYKLKSFWSNLIILIIILVLFGLLSKII
jgi:hypothetical protein